jgi:DNA-directed RNA polymerase subunit RPC12/RpoP
MNMRYYLKCEHCGQTILLRVGLGEEGRTSFSFECQNCSQRILGDHLVTWEEPFKFSTKLEGLHGAERTYPNDANQRADTEVTIHPHFAHQDIRVDEHFVSPFIQAVKRQPEHDAMKLFVRLALLNEVEHDVLPDVRRIVRNYRSENWGQFELGVRKYLPAGQPTQLPIDRNRALYHVLELAMAPFASSEAHLEVVNGLAHYAMDLSQAHAVAFTDVDPVV